MQETAKRPIPPAERMRTYRVRRRNGLRCMRVLLAEEEIGRLIARGFLRPNRRHSAAAIQDALNGFICQELGPPHSQR
jgi:hypothetical protein